MMDGTDDGTPFPPLDWPLAPGEWACHGCRFRGDVPDRVIELDGKTLCWECGRAEIGRRMAVLDAGSALQATIGGQGRVFRRER